MLSREEIEGELRDVFAKMSPDELERELNGAWRELVEEELANRSEAKRLEASRLEANSSRGKASRGKPSREKSRAKKTRRRRRCFDRRGSIAAVAPRGKLEVTYRGVLPLDFQAKAPLTQNCFLLRPGGKLAMDQSLENFYRVSCFGALLEFPWFSFSLPRCEIWSLVWLSCWPSPSWPLWPMWPRGGV